MYISKVDITEVQRCCQNSVSVSQLTNNSQFTCNTVQCPIAPGHLLQVSDFQNAVIHKIMNVPVPADADEVPQ